jgi:hypothetical protein
MRLSEAIALGRTLVHPIPSVVLDYGGLNGCALGMAYKASGKKVEIHPLEMSVGMDGPMNIWTWLASSRELPCKCNIYCGLNAGQIIAHLFDYHIMACTAGLCEGEAVQQDWTLDQLIDWVRSVEPNEDASESAEQLLEEIRQQAVAKP